MQSEFRNLVALRAVNTYGELSQIHMAVEEMAELTKALMKDRRDDVNHKAVRENIIEEIADVEIMIDQLKLIYHCFSDAENVKNFKINRLAERIERKKDKENKSQNVL